MIIECSILLVGIELENVALDEEISNWVVCDNQFVIRFDWVIRAPTSLHL
jgi:hypothetical protein